MEVNNLFKILILEDDISSERTRKCLEFCLDQRCEYFSFSFFDSSLKDQNYVLNLLKKNFLGFEDLHVEYVQKVKKSKELPDFTQNKRKWEFNSESCEILFGLMNGMLIEYPLMNGYSLGDWMFYKNGRIFLAVLSQDDHAVLYLKDYEKRSFENLNIPFDLDG